jgi:putative transposase
LRTIEAAVPTDLDIHLIVDNYSTNQHPKVKAWLAARLRWHLQSVPTYSSWLNLVERFFAPITGRAIRRGSFRSVRELIQRIDHFVINHNTDCKPLVWTATADSILAKLQRLSARISGTAHEERASVHCSFESESS